jgi:drug/metabolite transporter (DMT)-like permease
MAIPGSVIGLISYIEGQDRIEASEASLFVYLQPLIYLPLGLILLQEKIFTQQLVGLGLILLGVIVAEKRRGKKR